jgi:hypothetical protein
LEGGPPVFGQDFSCPALLMDPCPGFPYGALTRFGPPFQALPVPKTRAAGLVRVRSPLLTESRLMSVPPATEMFQFAGFASRTYRFSTGYPRVRPAGGLPHSETPGSPIARISPGLFAACRVLPRLSVPRHPPDALLFALPGPGGQPETAWLGTRYRRRAQRPAPAPGPEPGPRDQRRTSARPPSSCDEVHVSMKTPPDPQATRMPQTRPPPEGPPRSLTLPLHARKQHPGPGRPAAPDPNLGPRQPDTAAAGAAAGRCRGRRRRWWR